MRNLNKIDDSFVESYLEVLTDADIDQQVLCALDPKNTKQNNLFIKDPIVCERTPDNGQRFEAYDPFPNDDIDQFRAASGEDCE